MQLKEDFIELIMNCNWFENCGNEDFDQFEVVMLKDKKEVVKSINSMAWENVCLEKRGDFTAYLSLNCASKYNEFWNKGVGEVKRAYMGKLKKQFRKALANKNLPEKIIEDIEFNVVVLFMANYYSDYYSGEFFEQMLQIYLAGHLPCGWSGDLENGMFKIY